MTREGSSKLGGANGLSDQELKLPTATQYFTEMVSLLEQPLKQYLYMKEIVFKMM